MQPNDGPELAPNPCGCRWCHVCGMYGHAPVPPPPPPDPTSILEPKPVAPIRLATLFDSPETA
jgi:hypothetical protein